MCNAELFLWDATIWLCILIDPFLCGLPAWCYLSETYSVTTWCPILILSTYITCDPLHRYHTKHLTRLFIYLTPFITWSFLSYFHGPPDRQFLSNVMPLPIIEMSLSQPNLVRWRCSIIKLAKMSWFCTNDARRKAFGSFDGEDGAHNTVCLAEIFFHLRCENNFSLERYHLAHYNQECY